MAVSGMFALFYGLFRFIVEFYRVPDAHLGYLAMDWLTMGQILISCQYQYDHPLNSL
jgi:phosphatidylglycerol:prolipoprotein diacylglycerol transferase